MRFRLLIPGLTLRPSTLVICSELLLSDLSQLLSIVQRAEGTAAHPQGHLLFSPFSNHKQKHGTDITHLARSISASDLVLRCRQYLVADPVTLEAVIIDPVLDFDLSSGTVSTETADHILSFSKSKDLKIIRILYVIRH